MTTQTKTNSAVQSAEALRQARAIYRSALIRQRNVGNPRGYWAPAPETDCAELLRQVECCEANPDTVLKEDRRVLVLRAPLLSKDAVIKRYQLEGWLENIKYLARWSRARRYWAAARTLSQLGIPTPEPYGFLEIRKGGIPVRSYVFTAYAESAVAARLWIEPEFHRQGPELKQACAQALLESLLTLYRHGIYHRDTKTSNILLRTPVTPQKVDLLWIDLECVQCGRAVSRHDIVRNLVQLNGSLGSQVSEEDRCEFLQSLAKTYPWVTEPAVKDKIKRWTAWRLGKERRLGCGS